VRTNLSYGVIALFSIGFVSGLCAQDETPAKHKGFPQDWSTHHIVFTRDGLVQHPEILDREPRVLNQAMQRWSAPDPGAYQNIVPQNVPIDGSGANRDWNVALGKGRVTANMYPAKFTFDPAVPPSCANDYAVFGLTVAGSGSQANLVGFNNLYSGSGGICGASGPSVMFAYNITTVSGGKIITSPVISEDGTKIAFVESVIPSASSPSAAAIFHVLTFTPHQGTITAAATPTAMTSLTFSPTKDDSTSSPWVDYSADVAYVGADDGRLYKITGVFKGTPALAPGWPVLIALNNRLSPPVLDSNLNLLMVGSGTGTLYQVNTNNPSAAFLTLTIGKRGAKSSGILTAPVVDVTNGTTFAASANDGISSAVLVQADTSTLGVLTRVTLGQGSSGGVGLYIQEPAFDNQYFNDPSTGHIFVCGTAVGDTSPWEYSFGFGFNTPPRNMNSTTSFSQQLLTSTAAQCTGWTEFFNPNIGGGTDFFFFGLTQDCTGTSSLGCLVERVNNTTVATATLNGGPSGIIVDNYSTAGQASNVYVTAEKSNIAYKFTQNGLQ
jgi:hypothetical protein